MAYGAFVYNGELKGCSHAYVPLTKVAAMFMYGKNQKIDEITLKLFFMKLLITDSILSASVPCLHTAINS